MPCIIATPKIIIYLGGVTPPLQMSQLKADSLKNSILIIAGETSGDNVGGLLCAELKKLRPDLELFGLGGDRMKNAGVDIIYHANQLSFLGFWEVVKNLPFIREVERNVLAQIDQSKPSLAILIDYPGFNLRLAKKLRERKIPIIYYVSPQVWAWGKGRIQKIKSLVDKMIVVFDFERQMYKKEGMDVEWYGHPLLEIVRSNCSRDGFLKNLGLSPDDRYIGLFPGSRKQEIARILPEMKATIELLNGHGMSYKGIVGCVPGIDEKLYKDIGGGNLIYVQGRTYDLMAHSELNLIASGTATLECAILGRPLFVLYKTSAITYHIARRLIKIPHIGLVNVVAGKKIVPEYIQSECQAAQIAQDIEKYFSDEIGRTKMVKNLSAVRACLGEPGASAKVAQSVMAMIERKGN